MVKNIFTELLNMIWDIYWPLALGFMISAIVRAFISTKTISDKLGKNDLKSLSLAGFFGAISSSCSYAAASMGRTLITKGATWSNAVAFMIASTNLVFEIFLVIVTLLGWAFFGGEILGGLLLIAVGALFIKLFFSKTVIENANAHIKNTEAAVLQHDPHAHHADIGMEMQHHDSQEHQMHHEHHHDHNNMMKPQNNFVQKWKEAAGYFYMDVMMVGRDIIIGIIIAAILSVIVPLHTWQGLFLQSVGHYPQFIVILWNALIGIVVALLAFVCSVGNILLAAVLWHGGINFGGVIAFILADLVTLPMLMVYRRYYGIKMMWRLLLILSAAILITSIGVDYIFQLFHWIPDNHGGKISMHTSGIHWNAATILNLIFIPLSIFFFFWERKKVNNFFHRFVIFIEILFI